VRAALIAFVLAVAATAAGATPSEDLALARQAFRDGQFSIALEKYNALLYPELRLASTGDLVEAYVGLGVCRLETGDDAGAQREFERALALDPNHQLDALVITNRRAIELFDDTKTEIRVRGEREAAKQREAAEKERLRKLRESLVPVQKNYWGLNFVPGAGQFQNGHRIKGAVFLSGQIATGLTSLAIAGYLVQEYGFRSNQVRPDDAASVRRLQQVQVTTGLAFWGLYVWGVIDAFYHYKPQTRTELDESLLPPELRDAAPAAKRPSSPRSSLRLVPMLSPDGAGIGLSWER
jgi:tetratricopeptide (TPR) repeat protein